MKEPKIYKYIDQLLLYGLEEEAVPLIEEVWRNQAEEADKMLAGIALRLDALEKRKETIR